ncbi:unnamed protein product [Eruca vesicaria subsp. sativa]|uniref:Defensin-like domain-containing protein n=1 Tax=Eruca vesicaria subsp. sativa TaxID=29727 RepID=A0ABC8M2G1_ERUVS|nr:unnamed protein product [Eruca vesicaria subsp. sativa]
MANTQKLVFFSLVILAASMFNNNILVSGGEYENKITYTYCLEKILCVGSLAFDACLLNCTYKGYKTGTCIIVPDPKNPRARCCCGYPKPSSN